MLHGAQQFGRGLWSLQQALQMESGNECKRKHWLLEVTTDYIRFWVALVELVNV